MGPLGLFQFDLVAAVFGGGAAAVACAVYILVGLGALYQAILWKSIQRRWCGAC